MCLHRCSKKVLLKILKRFVGPEKYAGPAKRFMLHFDSATGNLANITVDQAIKNNIHMDVVIEEDPDEEKGE